MLLFVLLLLNRNKIVVNSIKHKHQAVTNNAVLSFVLFCFACFFFSGLVYEKIYCLLKTDFYRVRNEIKYLALLAATATQQKCHQKWQWCGKTQTPIHLISTMSPVYIYIYNTHTQFSATGNLTIPTNDHKNKRIRYNYIDKHQHQQESKKIIIEGAEAA